MGGGCWTIINSDYHPVLALPSAIRKMDPAWKACGLAWQGAWDPPKTLQPAEAIDPLTTSVGSQYPITAAPQSTVSGPASNTASPADPATTTIEFSAITQDTSAALARAQSSTQGNETSTYASNSQPARSSDSSVAVQVTSTFQIDHPSSSGSCDAENTSHSGAVPEEPLSTSRPTSDGQLSRGTGVSSMSGSSTPSSEVGQTFTSTKASDGHVTLPSTYSSPINSSASNAAQVLSAALSSDSTPIQPSQGQVSSLTSASAGAASPPASFTTAQPSDNLPSESQATSSGFQVPGSPERSSDTVAGLSASDDPVLPQQTVPGAALSLGGATYTAYHPASNTIVIAGAHTTATIESAEATNFAGSNLASQDNSGDLAWDGHTISLDEPTELSTNHQSSSATSAELQAQITLGSIAITAMPLANGLGTVQLGSTTLVNGGQALSFSGHTLSAASDGLVEDGTSTVSFTSPRLPAMSVATVIEGMLDLGSTSILVSEGTNAGVWVLGGQTLSTDGPALTTAGHTLSALVDGVVADGRDVTFQTTTKLTSEQSSGTPSTRDASLPVITTEPGTTTSSAQGSSPSGSGRKASSTVSSASMVDLPGLLYLFCLVALALRRP
jgi:hypothetical protein